MAASLSATFASASSIPGLTTVLPKMQITIGDTPFPEQAVRLEDKGSIGPEVAPDLLGEPDRLCSVVLAS
jgi:hypothetical protein